MSAAQQNALARLSRGPYRVIVECELDFEGPLHVGTGQRLSLLTDAPLLRDHEDRPALPASSIRGVIRDWCEREASLLDVPRDALRCLFGASPAPSSTLGGRRAERAGKNRTDDRQGRLTVVDLDVRASGTDIRDHVTIDRAWGAAKEGGKFDQETADIESGLLTLVYEGNGPADAELKLLASVVAALEDGLLSFGGKTGWGLGAARVRAVRWTALDRAKLDALRDYCLARLSGAEFRPVAERPSVEYPQPRALEKEDRRPCCWLALRIQIQFEGPMLVAGPCRSIDTAAIEQKADAAYQTDRAGRPLLAGSSLRGALRSHAERLVSTHRGWNAELATRLFGKAPSVVDGERFPGRKGLVRIGEGKLAGETAPVLLNHVAIDRVTGFAVDQRLFSAVALGSPCFESEFLVRWDPGDATERAAVALFLRTLRDAEDGLLWVGSRTSRGYGHVAGLRIVRAATSLLERCEDVERECWRRVAQRPLTARTVDDVARALAGAFDAKSLQAGEVH